MKPLVIALLLVSSASSAAEVRPFPDCASPVIQSGVAVIDDALSFEGLPRIVRAGNSFRVTLDGRRSLMLPGAPANARVVQLGRLAAGTYNVDVYRRDLAASVSPDETFAGSVKLSVRTTVPAAEICGPATATVTRGAFQSTEVGHDFPEPIEVTVLDAQGRPVRDVVLRARHISDSNAQTPSATFDSPTASTNTDGVAIFTGRANQVAGVSDFRFAADLPQISPRLSLNAYAVFHNRRVGVQPNADARFVVGFFSDERGHYFQTGNREEIGILDAKPAEEWRRSGSFLALSADSTITDAHRVCRFYGLPSAGLDSHFFSASAEECAIVAVKFKQAWALETDNAFRVYLPNLATGACPAVTVPVYRLFNNRPDANHIYTTNKSSRDALAASGFISEGYGPDGVVWCAVE